MLTESLPLHQRSWPVFDTVHELCMVIYKGTTPHSIEEIITFPGWTTNQELKSRLAFTEKENPSSLVKLIPSKGFIRSYRE